MRRGTPGPGSGDHAGVAELGDLARPQAGLTENRVGVLAQRRGRCPDPAWGSVESDRRVERPEATGPRMLLFDDQPGRDYLRIAGKVRVAVDRRAQHVVRLQ